MGGTYSKVLKWLHGFETGPPVCKLVRGVVLELWHQLSHLAIMLHVSVVGEEKIFPFISQQSIKNRHSSIDFGNKSPIYGFKKDPKAYIQMYTPQFIPSTCTGRRWMWFGDQSTNLLLSKPNSHQMESAIKSAIVISFTVGLFGCIGLIAKYVRRTKFAVTRI